MKKLLCVVCVVCCGVLCVSAATGTNEDIAVQDKADLKLTLFKTGESADDIDIKVMIENVGKNKVTVLDQFQPFMFDLFLSMELWKVGGKQVFSHGEAKVEFYASDFRYVTLEPGELIGTTIILYDSHNDPHGIYKVKDRLKTLAPGNYKFKVEYFNQYGKGCFQGSLTSNTIDIVIGQTATKPASTTMPTSTTKPTSATRGSGDTVLN